jgi:hypothetical protein
MQGFPSKLILSKTNDMKKQIIKKGNHHTFQMYPDLATKMIKNEERHSHLIVLKLRVLQFTPYCRSTAQGIQIRPGKDPRTIWDGLTEYLPEQVVLNKIMPTALKAVIDFGKAKTKLLISIYNWKIRFPLSIIYIALADITACF